MKRFICAALLTFVLVMMGQAQTAITPQMQNAPARKSPLAEYAGAWIGTFEGHTWITVRLNNTGTTLNGTLQRPNELQFRDSGDLKSVSQETLKLTIQHSEIQGDGLLITARDPGTQEESRYVMRLTSGNTAELKMVGMPMPPGMGKPKPWELSRIGPSAITPVR